MHGGQPPRTASHDMNDGAGHRDTEGTHSQARGPVDWFLVELVRRANTGGLSLGLTLCVGGVLVSGALIGGREYFEGFAEDVVSAVADPAVAGKAREFFRSPAAMYRQEDGATEGIDPELAEPLAYIHMKNARFFTPNGEPVRASHGDYWR